MPPNALQYEEPLVLSLLSALCLLADTLCLMPAYAYAYAILLAAMNEYEDSLVLS